jgi:hypothetical protein
MLLYAVGIANIIISIVTDVINFDFTNVIQTVCCVVLLCLLVLFIESTSKEVNDGSLIVNDADEVYLVLDNDISELRKKSNVNLSVYLSHSS